MVGKTGAPSLSRSFCDRVGLLILKAKVNTSKNASGKKLKAQS
jgi:hypothetical protein